MVVDKLQREGTECKKEEKKMYRDPFPQLTCFHKSAVKKGPITLLITYFHHQLQTKQCKDGSCVVM